MPSSPALVMKFGGASVATPEHFAMIADIIIEKRRSHPRLAVVVSAMGDTTDQLIYLANSINPNPPQREYDMLITVGERISIALLAMALAAKGHSATSFTGSQSGIITCDNHTNAKIVEVRPHRLLQTMDNGDITIVAGFQGVSKKNEITTLGRGGSDTSAVALAIALEAEKAEFYKDVSGIFDADPKENPAAKKYNAISYDDLLQILKRGSTILHPRCVFLAQKNRLPLYVTTFAGSDDGTQGTCVGFQVYSEERRCDKFYEVSC